MVGFSTLVVSKFSWLSMSIFHVFQDLFLSGHFILGGNLNNAMQYFPSTVGQIWLKNEITQNFKKNIAILGRAKARS